MSQEPGISPLSKSESKGSFFVTPDGQNVAFTFTLVSSLFLLWGFGNGMIDVMDKHFQDELNLSLSQSAWVQFAHYLGYFLMSIPAGWLASKLGYKGGIIAGLLMVAVGGFWFIPATRIEAFWAFLLGVCLIASGFTFLETVANPYTTVLGDPKYAASRINLAQSCNGIGWIFGPIAGSFFFYSTDAAGQSTGSQTLWIPYAGIGIVVLVLSVVFFFAKMPDIRGLDDSHADSPKADAAPVAERKINRGFIYLLLWFNSVLLAGASAVIVWLIFTTLNTKLHLSDFFAKILSGIPMPKGMEITTDNSLTAAVVALVVLASIASAFLLIPKARNVSPQSIWSHPHFLTSIGAQFFYVAAQAGIFSFFINYVTTEVPDMPASWRETSFGAKWLEVGAKFKKSEVKDLPALADRIAKKSDPVAAFLESTLTPETRMALEDFRAGKIDQQHTLFLVVQDLNIVVSQDPNKIIKDGPDQGKKPKVLANPQLFAGVKLGKDAQAMLDKRMEEVKQDEAAEASGDKKAMVAENRVNVPYLNRLLLRDAFPEILPFNEGIVRISDKFASLLASVGFICFLIGRFTGSGLLKKFSAHKVLALYGLLNVVACFVVFAKLGWLSVFCVFASYFLMSIMFPTIFALGIFGLGSGAKRASSFIVMAIMGGAVLPKAMGHVADLHDMSRSFIVPMVCFGIVTLYGLFWSKLSQAESLNGAKISGGH